MAEPVQSGEPAARTSGVTGDSIAEMLRFLSGRTDLLNPQFENHPGSGRRPVAGITEYQRRSRRAMENFSGYVMVSATRTKRLFNAWIMETVTRALLVEAGLRIYADIKITPTRAALSTYTQL